MCNVWKVFIETPLKTTAENFNAQLAKNRITVPNYNICPSENVSVVISNFEQRRLGHMHWFLYRIGINQ